MNHFPARKFLFFILFLGLIGFQLILPNSIWAQTTPTPTPTLPVPQPTASSLSQVQWVIDPDVTVVGKSADRARQFLWWVYSHQAIHSAPVIAELWGFSRNVVYIFIILVIVAFGVGLILNQKRSPLGPVFSGISSPLAGMNPASIFIKLVMILLYVTFSYVLILALVQMSDIIMRFFIENVGGKDLFNVIFSGSGNTEANYISFVGQKDANPLNLEMVKTSLFVINFTSFTYYVMGLIVILRTIILWFLMILSPFLALLMPFVFIRNIGWIWIGVFFQWLFYGPLMALFLAALTRIWISGIPFPFDFSRVDTPGGQVYRTSINILYGGPAQTLSTGNSSNYIDTFTEYIIALVMLWATMILPWLLLRIFRDYCCDLLAKGNATLASVFDRIRQYPLPPPSTGPPAPTTVAGMAVELPFRQRIEEKIHEVSRTSIENIKEVSRVNSIEIAKSMDMSVSSLSDVSRFELNQAQKSEVQKNLEKIAAPDRIASESQRTQYSSVRSELQKRAFAGDQIAATILAAAQNDKTALTQQVEVISTQRTAVAAAPAVFEGISPAVPTVTSTTQIATVIFQPSVVSDIATQVNITPEKVKEVLQTISTMNMVNMITMKETAKKTNVPEKTVQEIVLAAQMAATKAAPAAVAVTPAGKKQMPKSIPMAGKVIQTQVSVEDYEDVKKMWLNHYRETPVPISEGIKDRKVWLAQEEKKLTNVSNLLASSDEKLRHEGLEKVAGILPFMLLGGFTDAEILTYIKAKEEATRQVQTELEVVEKAKEEAKKELKEEEETLLEVAPAKKEEAKHFVMEEKKKMETPKEKTKNEE